VKPQLWVCAGPNGAGKTTLVKQHNKGRLPVINADDLLAADPSLGPLGAGRKAIALQKAALQRKESVIVETTLSGRRELEFMQAAKDAGFKVNLAYVTVNSPKTSRLRVAARVQSGGHHVPSEDVTRRYERSKANLATAMAIADRTFIFDNSLERRRLILVQEQKRVRAVARQIPKAVKPHLDKSVRQGFTKARERKDGRGR